MRDVCLCVCVCSVPNELKNVPALDVYVVNTPVQDNMNELRPVKPPRPMSAHLRARAKRAALLRKQLVHDIPEPQARVKPKTQINTLSAYEPTLSVSKKLRRLRRIKARAFDDPLAGGMGGRQLKGVQRTGAKARFAQLNSEVESRLPGTGIVVAGDIKAVGAGRGPSFDLRDGPPRKLDDLLPLKAQLVEELEPLGAHDAKESVPVGWGTPPAHV
jgi:hypothetical protein